jgi:F-box and leucine-rich repeat protein 7
MNSKYTRKGLNRSETAFDKLPDEMVIKIFEWFNSYELCQLSIVCRRFEYIVWNTQKIWKHITLKGEHINGDKSLTFIFRRLCGQNKHGLFPFVERIFLSDGCRISDKGIHLLSRRCPEISHLQMQNSTSVSNKTLCDFVTKTRNTLQHLDISGKIIK